MAFLLALVNQWGRAATDKKKKVGPASRGKAPTQVTTGAVLSASSFFFSMSPWVAFFVGANHIGLVLFQCFAPTAARREPADLKNPRGRQYTTPPRHAGK
nr:hypothetical protein [Pandoravirus aubagnensis]